MNRVLLVAGLVALAAPSLGDAQTVRWNDTPTATWSDEAPRVRVSIEGQRGVSYGGPVLVRFEVSDNAYVAVVRVAGDGRMTILFPYSRTQRAAVRAGTVHYIRHPRMGGYASFYANDQFSGYVFAIASYAPLDLSRFENRDYERIGGWSTFTRVNRSSAFRPDVYIDRFAAAVLWDNETPFDYDVDYYHTAARPLIRNAYAMCGSMFNGFTFSGLSHRGDWADWDLMPYPYNAMCREWYSGMRCLSLFMLYNYAGCYSPQVAYGPTVPGPGQPSDTTQVPNEGVVRGGMSTPTPTPIPGGDTDAPPLERRPGRFDQPGGVVENEWDRLMSIPKRATKKMKAEDEQRAAAGSAPARASFERGAGADAKPEKTRIADHGERTGSVRTPPPSREPTKVKGTSEPRRETTSTGSRGFGSTGSTGRTSPDPVPERSSRPAETSRPANPPASPPKLQGSGTEKKKPPTN